MDDSAVTAVCDAGGEILLSTDCGAAGGDDTRHAELDAGVDAHCFAGDGDEIGH
jgi:hypothetical protein